MGSSWNYRALGRQGEPLSGLIEAPGRDQAVRSLLSSGMTPIAVSEAQGEGRLAPQRERIPALRSLAIMLEARVPVATALEVAATTVPAKAASRLMKTAGHVRSGTGLSASLSKSGLLNPSDGASIAASETAGQLPVALNRLVQAEERRATLRAELVSALTYPLILVVALVITLAVIFRGVVPSLIPIFRERMAELPWTTRGLLGLDQWLSDWGTIAALAIALAGVIGWAWSRSPTGRSVIDQALVSSRWSSLPRDMGSAELARTLGGMLEGGVALAPAMERASQGLTNTALRDAAAKAQRSVREGRKLTDALAVAGHFSPILVAFARVGEETGRLSQLLGQAAGILDEGVRSRLSRFGALAAPVATLVLGLVVGLVMSGIVGGILAADIRPR